MVAAKAKSFWNDLPSAVRAGAYAGGLLLTLFGGVALGDGSVPKESPSRLDRLEANDARQDTILARTEPQTNYLFCVDLADRNLTNRTPADCFETYATGR